jgi:hypothetical protein
VYSDPQESARRMILGVGANNGATSALHRSVSLTQTRSSCVSTRMSSASRLA